MASSTKFTSDPIPSLDRIVLYFRFIGKGLEYVQKEVELRTGIKKCYGPQQEIIMKKWVAFFKKQDATKLEWKNINALELGEVLGRGVKKRSFDAHLKLRKELKMRSKKQVTGKMKADDPVFKDNDLYIAAFGTYLKVIAQETLAEMRDDEYGVDLNDCLIDLENH